MSKMQYEKVNNKTISEWPTERLQWYWRISRTRGILPTVRYVERFTDKAKPLICLNEILRTKNFNFQVGKRRRRSFPEDWDIDITRPREANMVTRVRRRFRLCPMHRGRNQPKSTTSSVLLEKAFTGGNELKVLLTIVSTMKKLQHYTYEARSTLSNRIIGT